MAKLIINSVKPPITYKKENKNFICSICEDFRILKIQTLDNFKYQLEKEQSQDPKFFVPDLCNQILLAITSFNHFLLNINIILEKTKKKNNYEKIVLENIYEHQNTIFQKDKKFKNNLSSQFKYLFENLKSNFKFEEKDIENLQEIAKVFIIVEAFFRNHQAHGNTNSIIEFFNEFTFNGYIFYMYNKNIVSSGNVEFFFSMYSDKYSKFFQDVSKLLDISKSKINNDEELKRFEKDELRIKESFNVKISSKNSSDDLNPLLGNIFYINGSLMRTYLKYKSLVSLDVQEAVNINAIEDVLRLYRLTSNEHNGYEIMDGSDQITPIALFNKMKSFVEIIEKKILK